jgi:hypothetical protein
MSMCAAGKAKAQVAKPALLTPAYGRVYCNTDGMDFSWSDVSADSYVVEFARDKPWLYPGPFTLFTVNPNTGVALDPTWAGEYYWRVKAIKGAQESPWSDPGRFVVRAKCNGKVANDFDADGITDLVVYDPPTGHWYVRASATESPIGQDFGGPLTVPLPGHYGVGWHDDPFCDFGVCDPAPSRWHLLVSYFNPNFSWGWYWEQQWGWDGAVFVPGDYDGDRSTDVAVYDRVNAVWYIQKSSDGTLMQVPWGWPGLVPVPADYDNDGKCDVASYHPATGYWYIRKSSDTTAIVQQWGWSEGVPVPGDYDGDGFCDLGVYHRATGNWHLRKLSGGGALWQWGWSAAMPVPADYDGDGACDLAVYHPATGFWYVRKTTRNGGLWQQGWGYPAALVPTLQYQINQAFGLLP